MNNIRWDARAKKWWKEHRGIQTTMCKCEKCGLYYKPQLGHECEKDGGAGQ